MQENLEDENPFEYFLQSTRQIGIEFKKENRTLSISPIKKKTRVKFLVSKVGDQVLLEIPATLEAINTSYQTISRSAVI
jgi:hypothetical protein